MIVDCAVYVEGRRVAADLSLDEAHRRSAEPGAFVWIGLFEPTEAEFASVAARFELHELAAEDAVHAHQRPKLERYGDTWLLVLKPARYDDEREQIELGEILVLVGRSFVVAVRHGTATPLAEVREQLEGRPEMLQLGPPAVVHAILDRVVDEYAPVIAGLEQDVEEVEEVIFSGQRSSPVDRVYFLKREVLEFHRATAPLRDPLRHLVDGDHEFARAAREYFRDVHDHLLRIDERVEALRELLTSVLEAALTQIGIRQNEDMRRISAWVAIAAVPTAIGGIYGMNLEGLPLAGRDHDFLVVFAVMVVAAVALFATFRRRGWL